MIPTIPFFDVIHIYHLVTLSHVHSEPTFATYLQWDTVISLFQLSQSIIYVGLTVPQLTPYGRTSEPHENLTFISPIINTRIQPLPDDDGRQFMDDTTKSTPSPRHTAPSFSSDTGPRAAGRDSEALCRYFERDACYGKGDTCY